MGEIILFAGTHTGSVLEQTCLHDPHEHRDSGIAIDMTATGLSHDATFQCEEYREPSQACSPLSFDLPAALRHDSPDTFPDAPLSIPAESVPHHPSEALHIKEASDSTLPSNGMSGEVGLDCNRTSQMRTCCALTHAPTIAEQFLEHSSTGAIFTHADPRKNEFQHQPPKMCEVIQQDPAEQPRVQLQEKECEPRVQRWNDSQACSSDKAKTNSFQSNALEVTSATLLASPDASRGNSIPSGADFSGGIGWQLANNSTSDAFQNSVQSSPEQFCFDVSPPCSTPKAGGFLRLACCGSPTSPGVLNKSGLPELVVGVGKSKADAKIRTHSGIWKCCRCFLY